MNYLRLSIRLFMLNAFILLLITGCEGDAGKPGVSKLPSDLNPPVVELIQPLAPITIYSSVVFEAYLFDDSGIEALEYLVDGRIAGEGNVILHNFPWQIVWDCSNLLEGLHTVQARAWDTAGKSGFSQVVFMNKAPSGLRLASDTLRYYSEENDQFEWAIPDTLYPFSGIGTRFTPVDSCRVANIGVFIGTTYGSDESAKFNIEVWLSDNGDLAGIVYEKEVDLRAGPGEADWYWPSISNWDRWVFGEFFVMLNFTETALTDTFLVYTDSGTWRNYHGIVMRDEGISDFMYGGVAYNPLIYTDVRY